MPYDWPFGDDEEAPKEKGFLEELGDAIGLAKQLGRGLLDLPTEVKGSIASIKQFRDVPAPGVETPEEASIREAGEASKRRMAEAPTESAFGVTPRDIESTVQSIGGSVTTLGAGALGAIPGAAVGGVGALATGGTASFIAGKRMDENQLLRTLRDSVHEDLIAKRGEGLTEKEWEDIKAKAATQVNLHGLAESLPETAGDVASILLALSPLGRIPGISRAIPRIATKLAGIQATELATETITRQLQQPVESELGLTGGEGPRSLTSGEDWLKSLNEIAAPTIIQTALMGGGEVAIGETINRYRQEAAQDKIIETDTVRQPVLDENGMPLPPAVEEPEFRNWFAGSKVADEAGNPLVLYHGTKSHTDFEEAGAHNMFTKTRLPFFMTDKPPVANSYADPTIGITADAVEEEYQPKARVLPVFASIQNPLVMDAQGARWDEIQDPMTGKRTSTDEVVRWARTNGYDGVIFRNIVDTLGASWEAHGEPSTVAVAFKPEQVKSALGNKGTFDPSHPSLLLQQSVPDEATLLTVRDIIENKSREEYEFAREQAERRDEVQLPWPKFLGESMLDDPAFSEKLWDTMARGRVRVYNAKGKKATVVGNYFNPAIGQRLIDTAGEALQRFAPKANVIISDSTFEKMLVQDKDVKLAWLPDYLKQADGWISRHESGAYHLFLNSLNFFENGKVDEVKLFSTLTHELGHLIAFENLKKTPHKLLDTLSKDYIQWAATRLDKTLEETIKTRWAPRQAADLIDYIDGFDPSMLDTKVRDLLKHPNWDIGGWGKSAIRPEYMLSPDEWMAENFSKWSQAPGQGLDDMGRFWLRLNSIMNKFFSYQQNALNFSPNKGYVEWLNHFDRQKLKGIIRGDFKETVGDIVSRTISGVFGQPPNAAQTIPQLNPNRVNGEMDRWNKFIEQLYTVPQIADLNPHINDLQLYVRELEAMAATKNKILHQGQETYLAWARLGKERMQNVSKFLLEETVGGVPLNLNDLAVLSKYNLDSESVQVITRIKADFAAIIDTFERVLTAHTIEELQHDPQAMQREVNRLHAEMSKLKSKPFFPLARFGNYSVVIEAAKDFVLDGRTIKQGTVFDMRTFENQANQLLGLKEAQGDYAAQIATGEVTIGQDFIEDVVFEFQGVPPQIFERIEGELVLTPGQLKQLHELKIDLLPGKSYLKHMQKRRGILGYSEDGPRAYTNYMLRAANHLARLQHYKRLSATITGVGESATAIRKVGGDAVKRRKIHQYMAETYRYVMNPTNDWAGLRSAAFQYFIGLNPKQALVNLVQVPLATYPELAANFGDAKAIGAIGQAMNQVKNILMRPQAVPQEIRDLMIRATDAGFIEQTFASTMANVAEAGVLTRALPGTAGARVFRQMGYISSYMFSQTEKFNRQVTLVAAYNLARKRGDTIDQAYNYAHKAVQRTQGEYSKWARPKLMRGKKGVFFIFKSYTQFMLYFMLHNPARIRMMMMLGLMGGLSALPFAEDLFDLTDYALSRGGKKFSSRKELMALAQEYLTEVGIKPELAMHGIARDSFGWAYFGDFMGIPIPRVDLSRSVSMGRVVPGIEAFNYPSARFFEKVGRVSSDVAGAGLAIPLTVARVISDYERYPDKARALEDLLPTWAKSLARGYRYATEGAVTDRQHRTLIEFDPLNPEHKGELIATALGFQPTRLNQKYEQRDMQRQHVEYYQARREVLLQDFAYSRVIRDREANADVRDAIKKYNSEVPDPKLRITGADMRVSLRRRLRNMAKMNRNLPLEGRRYRGLYRQIDEVFTSDEDVIEEELRNLREAGSGDN